MPKLIDVVALSKKNCRKPIRCELKYATPDNFIGRVIDGYSPEVTAVALLTEKVATVLCDVQNTLIKNHNVSLCVFDAYRPRRAVDDFLRWAAQPENDLDQERKRIHYPHVEKSQLFSLSYLGKDSQHCYGNTVDCVLQDLNGNLLEMGAIFDFFDRRSHIDATSKDIGQKAFHHRQILSEAMQDVGFKPHRTEYWHFSHPDLRETDKAMDIPITSEYVIPAKAGIQVN